MRIRSALSGLLLWSLLSVRAWGDPLPAREPGDSAPGGDIAASRDAAAPAARSDVSAAYLEHAPLAWFSVGSLAVGGAFYAIGRGLDRPGVSYASGTRSQMSAAVAVAGASAMLAAATYFYYVHKGKERDEPVSDWEASLIGVPDGSGGLALAGRISLPLPALR